MKTWLVSKSVISNSPYLLPSTSRNSKHKNDDFKIRCNMILLLKLKSDWSSKSFWYWYSAYKNIMNTHVGKCWIGKKTKNTCYKQTLLFCFQNCSDLLHFKRPRILKFFEISATIYANSSVQFLKECFLNLLLRVCQIWYIIRIII